MRDYSPSVPLLFHEFSPPCVLPHLLNFSLTGTLFSHNVEYILQAHCSCRHSTELTCVRHCGVNNAAYVCTCSQTHTVHMFHAFCELGECDSVIGNWNICAFCWKFHFFSPHPTLLYGTDEPVNLAKILPSSKNDVILNMGCIKKLSLYDGCR